MSFEQSSLIQLFPQCTLAVPVERRNVENIKWQLSPLVSSCDNALT